MSAIDERIAHRRHEVRQARQRARRRRTFTLLAAALLLGAFLVVERSPLVGLEDVQVVGTDRLDADDVRSAAGLERGTSTLRVRLRTVEERVEALPAVRTARASRTDPLTVRVEIVERESALVAQGAGQAVLVDRDGVVMATGTQAGLPLIRLTGRPPEPGGTVYDDPALANAYNAWRGLSGPLRAEVAGMVAPGPTSLTLELSNGVEVRFGRAERVDEKTRALGAILEDVGDTRISVIDVRAPGAPYIEP